MDYDPVDGSSPPDVGGAVRVRVLRGPDGQLVVDRPNRDCSLEVASDHGIAIPEAPGTYEIRGVVDLVTRAQSGGQDYLFLENPQVAKIADGLIEVPQETADWEETDSSGTDVDVDVDSVLPSETVTEQSESRGRLGGAESLRENYNELLLDDQ